MRIKFLIQKGHPRTVSDLSSNTGAKSACLALCLILIVAHAVAQPPIAMAAPGHWAEQTLAESALRGIVVGYPDGSVQPDRPVTRAELCTMIVRMLGEEDAAAAARRLLSSFNDVEVNYWGKGYLEIAREKGIFLGDSGDLAFPDRSVTRAEAVTMLDRCVAFLGVPLGREYPSRFDDSALQPAWATESVGRLAAAGLVLGETDGRFYPNRSLTRAEAATLTLRILASLGRRWDLEGKYTGLSPAGKEIGVECQRQHLDVPVSVFQLEVFAEGTRSALDLVPIGARVGLIIVNGKARFVAVLP